MQVYMHLLNLSAGFDLVIRSLEALRKHQEFSLPELDGFKELAKETRAATNSYLVGIVENAETEEAGRLLGKPWEQQQQAERVVPRTSPERRTPRQASWIRKSIRKPDLHLVSSRSKKPPQT